MRIKETAIVAVAILVLGASWAGAADQGSVNGYNRIEVPANSDVIVAPTMTRPAEGTHTVATDGVNAGSGVTADGTAFNGEDYSGGGYYVRFTETGYWSTITSNTDSDLVLEDTDFLGQISDGDEFKIYPHHTISSLLPTKFEQYAYIPSSDTTQANRGTEVLLPSDAADTNKSAAATYYYLKNYSFLGTTYNGWYKAGAIGEGEKGDTVIEPDSYLILRNNESGKSLVLILKGTVPTGKLATKVATESVDYDLNFSTGRPTSVKLGQLGLDPIWVKSSDTSQANRGDELLVFDNTDGNKNKSAAATYYYLDNYVFLGTTYTGWYKAGAIGEGEKSSVEIPASNGLIIRKKANTSGGYIVQDSPY